MSIPVPWRYFFYGFYAVSLTAVLLLARFPAESFRQFCEDVLQRHFPNCEAKIEAINFRFPGKLVLEKVGLTSSLDDQVSALIFENMSILFNYLQPKTIDVDAEFYSGKLTAVLTIKSENQDFFLNDLRLSGVDLARLVESLGFVEREVTGTLDFSGDYQSTWEYPVSGRGQGRVLITSGKFSLLQPVLSLSAIEYNQLTADLTINGEQLQLLNADLQSETLGADFSGQIRLTGSLPGAELVLSGLLKPEDAYLRDHPREQMLVQRLRQRYNTSGLPFHVGGTLSGPTFRFGGE
jgi:type II secretion system protein N